MNKNGNGKQIAVVGAGLAGLTAAYKLAEAGAHVTIFEKDHHSGGRAKTTAKDGFQLNLGPHALYISGHTYRFLSEVGLKPQGNQPKPEEPIAVVGGKMHTLPLSPTGIMLTGYLGLSDKLEMAMFMSKLYGLKFSELNSVSLADWLRRNIKSEKVRQTIECFVRLSTYSANPQEMAAGAAFSQLSLGAQGVLYLDNGWQTMVSSLENVLRGKFADHVRISHGTNIDGIHETRDGVELHAKAGKEGTESEQEVLTFDAAVLCVPPTDAIRLLPQLAQNSTLSTLAPNLLACLDVCLRRLPNPKRTFALGIDEPIYLSVHSSAAKLGPEGTAVLHAGYYFNGTGNQTAMESRLEELLDQVQPGWRNEVVYRRYLPHMVASYGTPTAIRNGASGLDNPRVGNNVYLCGDYIGSGAQLVDCSTASALQAVALVALGSRQTVGRS
jgi:phytoene dehydrogenase-like protein